MRLSGKNPHLSAVQPHRPRVCPLPRRQSRLMKFRSKRGLLDERGCISIREPPRAFLTIEGKRRPTHLDADRRLRRKVWRADCGPRLECGDAGPRCDGHPAGMGQHADASNCTFARIDLHSHSAHHERSQRSGQRLDGFDSECSQRSTIRPGLNSTHAQFWRTHGATRPKPERPERQQHARWHLA